MKHTSFPTSKQREILCERPNLGQQTAENNLDTFWTANVGLTIRRHKQTVIYFKPCFKYLGRHYHNSYSGNLKQLMPTLQVTTPHHTQVHI